MKNAIYILILIGTALGFSLLKACDQIKSERSKNDRYYLNMLALSDSTDYYRTKTGELAAVNSGYVLSLNELEEINDSLSERVKSLNIKSKNILTISNTKVVTEYITRDSTVYVPIKDTSDNEIRNFVYSDNWIDWKVNVRDCSVIDPGGFELKVRNEITVAAEVVYRRKHWYSICKKPAEIRVHTSGTNPYTVINQTDYVKIIP